MDLDSYWWKEIGMAEAYSAGEFFKVYFHGALFILNIASTAGYGNMTVYARPERIAFIFLVYVCTVFLAYTQGILALQTKLFPEKYNKIFNKISKINRILDRNPIPPELKFKIELYYSYLIEARDAGIEALDVVSEVVPKQIVKVLHLRPFINIFL